MPENRPDLAADEKVYNCKWEFTFAIRAPGPTFIAKNAGLMEARKIVMTDRGKGKVVIDVTGPLVGRGFATRSARFSLDGKLYPMAPDWLLEAVKIAGFAKVEM